jgi:hypothetical protein
MVSVGTHCSFLLSVLLADHMIFFLFMHIRKGE